ncbi:MAG: helix-turn-helix domain-containing protein [Microscillaceae bacterium]|jgi:transcriptional regulator with XRE-family HTH domain|nr:helix-turn-helix domain-containing protein [Microscillaceae bacterium]
MTLGTKIRFFRGLKGLSQENMADLLGMSLTGYAKIERGETDIAVSRLEQIAKVLDVKLEDITSFDEKFVFNNYGEKSQANGIVNNHHNFDQERKSYLDRIEQLEKQIQYLQSLVDSILKK